MGSSQFGRWVRLAGCGGVLLGLGSCLGPNPGFFIGSSAANASISTLVNSLLSGVFGLGGG